MDNDIKKRHIFSTNCILEAFNLGPGAKKQPHLFGHESADDLKNPYSLKGPSVRRPLGSQTRTGRFDTSLLAAKNITASNIDMALTSVLDLSAQLPDFPWLIFHRRVLVPGELISRFDLPTITEDSSDISFVQGEVLELHTELRSVTQFSAVESNNWHRSSLFSILGTIFRTMHEENSVLSESQVVLFATTLLSQSFGYFSGTSYSPNRERQQQPAIIQPTTTRAKSTAAVASRTATKSTSVTKPTTAVKKSTVSKTSTTTSIKFSTPKSMTAHPTTALKSTTNVVLNTDTATTCAACGFFLLKTNFAANQEVVSLLPNSKDLCTCLSLLSDLGVFLGSNEVLLPCCVVQYTGTGNEIDLVNLAKEMDQIHEINKLCWREAPRPYAVVVSGHTWQIQTLVAIDQKKKSVVVWAHNVHSTSDALYVAAVIYRFAAYLLETFKQLKPDFGKLRNLLQLKLRAKPLDINFEDWTKLSDKVHKFMEYKPSLHAKVPMVPNAVELPQHDVATADSASDDAIQRFFSKLSEDGFEDFKLIYQHATSKVYKAQRENKPLVVKIKHRKYVEQEAKILAALSGCGAVHMYKNGLINNSELGYLILEHLYPLPASISNARELQTITRQLMSIIAAVHQKNYIHRDIKPGNVMRNKDGSLRLIDFDCAIHKDDTDFDTCYGTHAFKPPELDNTHAPYCWTPKAMIGAKIQGSDKSDSYSAALVCAALMYNIELNELRDIEKVKEWLDEDRIEHVATPSAIELFQWMMHPIPELRLTATLSHCHTFLRKYIPVAKTKK